MAAAGRINAQFGSSIWEPVRVLLGDDYARGLAAMQLYDVLLVNSIADGMNLVAKEGPLVNQRDGVLILSERTGARQQLHPAALVISPCDIVDTAEALHRALVMPTEERHQRAAMLQAMIRSSDINDWFCQQIEEITRLEL
jgi:trehalose 6-phosphate synthase